MNEKDFFFFYFSKGIVNEYRKKYPSTNIVKCIVLPIEVYLEFFKIYSQLNSIRSLNIVSQQRKVFEYRKFFKKIQTSHIMKKNECRKPKSKLRYDDLE